MSTGKETAVPIATWMPYTQDTHAFVGNIKYCRRSQGGEPKWTLIATDTGEVRVYDYLGVHQSDHDIALGYNPDDVYINNEDIPLIAVKNGTTIRVYEEGLELFNTGAIANLQYINISNGYLHCTVGAIGVQFRSLTDGSVQHTILPTGGMDGNNIFKIEPTESGIIVFVTYRDNSGSRYPRLAKIGTTTTVWSAYWSSGGRYSPLKCAADGSMIVVMMITDGFDATRVYNGGGGVLNSYAPGASFTASLGAQPDGEYVAWARRASTTARIIKDDGTVVNVVLPANIVNREDATECVLGGYISFACTDGNIYVYDSAGNIKATINYGLAATPTAGVIK